MCTVSYLPLRSGGYILTSNRDEAPQRHAIEISHRDANGQRLVFPVDPLAGGTWFCISNQGKAGCVLNGATVPFTPNPGYTHSRGKMLLDVMDCDSLTRFAAKYDLAATAPFTVVLVEDHKLSTLIWDGASLDISHLDPNTPAFWSSVTLYPEDVRKWRRELFEQWLVAHSDFDQDEIMYFHRYGVKDDHWNGFVMNRYEHVKTLTITSVKKLPQSYLMKHSDLLTGKIHSEILDLTTVDVAKD